ncbi:MAG TPA: TlpA disulfide reductase family protein [Candidatus Binataceae bacterium]|nr:TlpA disulfide reductase family protein [Candidatus Binataceae bacterium]
MSQRQITLCEHVIQAFVASFTVLACIATPLQSCKANKIASPYELWSGASAIDQLDINYASGQPFNVRQFRGRILLLNFWAYWCPECASEFASMTRLQRAMGGPQFLGIMLVSFPKYWNNDQLFIERNHIPFPFGYFGPGWTANTLARAVLGTAEDGRVNSGLPVSYVFTPSGRPVVAVVGSQDWDDPQHMNFFSRIRSQ